MKYIMKTEPWAHQRTALRYLMKRDVAALYTDMGTGKSKIMIDLIVNRGFKLVLIVCTNKGCDVWERQFQIHSDIHPNFILNLSGLSTQEKVSLLESKKIWSHPGPLVVICNYESIWRPKLKNFLLRKSIKIDCVICDESHRIKSPSSKCSWFLSTLGKRVSCRYLVTGTPLAENPMDVYAQYRFLDPTIFGTSFAKFKERYQNIDAQISARVGFPVLNKQKPYINLDELTEKFYSCAFRAESSLELPKRLNVTTKFRLSSEAQSTYQELVKEGVLIYDEGVLEVNNVLSMSIRKQQLTSGFIPVLTDDNTKKVISVDKSRLDALEELLQGFSPSEPVVIFAKFRRDLDQIRELCEKLKRGYSELSGKVDTEKDWKAGKTTILGVQYKSGSESVDFTRARYCIYYSLTYSLALYEQSKKRMHRPGQTRSCVYYHIVGELDNGPSIDKVMLDALRMKKRVIDHIIEQRA